MLYSSQIPQKQITQIYCWISTQVSKAWVGNLHFQCHETNKEPWNSYWGDVREDPVRGFSALWLAGNEHPCQWYHSRPHEEAGLPPPLDINNTALISGWGEAKEGLAESEDIDDHHWAINKATPTFLCVICEEQMGTATPILPRSQ